MLKFMLSLGLYVSLVTGIVVIVATGSVVDSLQSLGAYLNGQATTSNP